MKQEHFTLWGKEYCIVTDYGCPMPTQAQTQLMQDVLRDGGSYVSKAMPQLEQYCAARDGLAAGDLPVNIAPHMLICNYDPKGLLFAALMCGYKQDPEHGIAMVFYPDGRIEVDSQDIVI